MTSQIRPYAPRVFVSEIIQPPAEQPAPATYQDIAAANNHLHKVLNALLKERSGQPLTATETHLIGLHIAAKQWQLKHTPKEQKTIVLSHPTTQAELNQALGVGHHRNAGMLAAWAERESKETDGQ